MKSLNDLFRYQCFYLVAYSSTGQTLSVSHVSAALSVFGQSAHVRHCLGVGRKFLSAIRNVCWPLPSHRLLPITWQCINNSLTPTDNTVPHHEILALETSHSQSDLCRDKECPLVGVTEIRRRSILWCFLMFSWLCHDKILHKSFQF